MKKVVLSLALVAMMFVSCKETEATPEEAVTEEVAPVVEEVATEVVADTAAVAVEATTEEVAK
jgi:PBP1b-binding outer membrane lipoprotein LpoB